MYLDGSAVENYEIDTLLSKVTCTVLLMRGEVALGGAIEDEDERRVLSLQRRPTLVRVASVGHFIHSQTPERYSQVVTNFLESLEGVDE